MRSAIFVSVVVLLACTLTEVACISLFGQSPFDKLNKFLTEHETSEDLAANVKVAKQILDGNSQDAKLLELTKNFVVLEYVDESNRCSSESLRLLSSTFRAMQDYVKNPHEDTRRLSRLIVGATGSCLDKLTEDFKKVRQSGQKADETIDNFTSYLSLGCKGEDMWNLRKVQCSLKQQDWSLNSPFDPINIFMGLMKVIGKAASKQVASKEQVGQSLDQHLYKSCEELTSNKERVAVIEQATWNLSTLKLTDELVPDYTMAMGDLLGSVANYLTCKRLKVTGKDRLVDSVFWWLKKSDRLW